jgi:hypothetical protein
MAGFWVAWAFAAKRGYRSRVADPIFVEMDVIGPETDATAKSPGR